jgi:hypothetical protein
MIAAMYENGGNTTQRFLDGHPSLFVYPFESQIGTRLVNDPLSSMFPVKYRWPVFALDATPLQDYRAIIDEEGKVRSRTPEVSKFRHRPFEMSDDERCDIYQNRVRESGRSRPNNVAAFFRATFEAWRDCRRSGEEQIYVGYSPIIVVDAGTILSELPDAHVLHVVRNPWSAYADTKKRPVPMSLSDYMRAWVVNQYHALHYREKFPDRLHIVRVEDVMGASWETLAPVCESLGIAPSESLRWPSWNSQALEEVAPWGTIRKATLEANRATAAELSDAEQADVRSHAWQYLEVFDYKSFL